MSRKQSPHGGKLINTMITDESDKQIEISRCDFEVELDARQLCDVELLMQGGFSPLSGFMNEENYKVYISLPHDPTPTHENS